MSRVLDLKVPPHMLGRYEQRFAEALKSSTRRHVEEFGRQALEILRMKSAGIKDLGAFQNGWGFAVLSNQLWLFNRSWHAPYVEGGRRAGAAMPPRQPIEEWVVRHGMPKSAWYPVAKKIAERGIVPRPVLNDPTTRLLLERAWDRVMDKAWDAAARSSGG